jgi:hypothetical protein
MIFHKNFYPSSATTAFFLVLASDNDKLSVAIEQSSAEDVWAAGMLVADDMLVLADDSRPYKCCFICSLTSYVKIKKFANTEVENIEKYVRRSINTNYSSFCRSKKQNSLVVFKCKTGFLFSTTCFP